MGWFPLGLSLMGPPGPAGPHGVGAPKAISVERPSADEKILFFYCELDCDVSELRYLAYGLMASSVTFSIRYGPDFAAAGTELRNGGILAEYSTIGGSVTDLDNGIIPAGNWVWLTTSALLGEIELLHVSMLLH